MSATNDKELEKQGIDSEFYLDNIPDFSKITLIFIKEKQKDDKLTVLDYHVEGEEPLKLEYDLKYSPDYGYMVPEQELGSNVSVMSQLFQQQISFKTETLDISEYNRILYSG